MIRVLTVRQPWAWLIARGGKDVENRPFSTMYRGPVAIVAGLSMDSEWESIYPPAASNRPPTSEALYRGGIICVVDLVDVVTDSLSMWAQPREFHWILGNVRTFEPIPYRGTQGLTWLDDPDVLERLDIEIALTGLESV